MMPLAHRIRPKEGALQGWGGPGLCSAEAEVAVAKRAGGGGMSRLRLTDRGKGLLLGFPQLQRKRVRRP